MKNKNVLVTGGAGFIGSNLIEDLLEDNKVVCLDNFSTGFKSNIDSFLAHPNFELIEGDITNLTVCREAVSNIDIVLHQAALGSVPRSIDNPIATNEANITGFLNLLYAAKEAKVQRFVYAASSSTYGDSKALPKIENEIGSPLSPYAVTKYVNELYAHVFRLNYGMEVIGLRYFNVYGRRQSPAGAYAAVIPKFTELFMDLKSPTINGDGSFSRDFTYIDNVLQMNHLAATTDNPAAIGEVFNVAVGERTTLLEMTELLKRFLSLKNPAIANVEIVHGPERQGDIPHSLASIEKAQKLLGYNPSHQLEKGLKEAVNWYWENLGKK
ncbi:MAG: SDR family oxidoreductase [Crocinitomicaceae bacterium]|nr:SDR family oxidoreductase [Crocinitomicaceae bacterium]